MTRGRLCLASLTGLLLTAGLAQAGEILYQNDFESGPLGPEWSNGRSLLTEGVFTRFNGRYGNSSTVLTLSPAPDPGGKNGSQFGTPIGAGGKIGGVIWGGGGGGGGKKKKKRRENGKAHI